MKELIQVRSSMDEHSILKILVVSPPFSYMTGFIMVKTYERLQCAKAFKFSYFFKMLKQLTVERGPVHARTLANDFIP